MSNDVKIIIGVIVASLVILVGAIVLMSKPQAQVVSNGLSTEGLIKSDSPIKGDGTKVTIVEFADFQCPACRAIAPTLENIVASQKDVRLVFRHFPLSQHRNAIPAAKAAEAAGRQNKFWEMYHLLYTNQDEWAESGSAGEIFIKYAGGLGLDIQQFEKDSKDPAFQEKIARDFQEGSTIGVNSTPTIFINGKKFEGSVTDLTQAVTEEREQ